VYRAGPPGGGAADGGGPLRVSGAGRRVFEGSSTAALDPALRVYLADLVAPYGLALADDLLDQGSGHSYGEMAGTLLEQTLLEQTLLAQPAAAQPIDLLVLAFAIHDVIPGRSTAAHLSQLCPGNPTAFAGCEQGSAAPFTGLRLIREYARTAGCRRALLVVVEQATLHYEPAAPVALPARHAAVALVCGELGSGRLDAIRQHAGVSARQARDLLATEVAALAAGRGDVTLVLGNGLTRPAGKTERPVAEVPGSAAGPGSAAPVDIPAVDQVLVAPAGQPLTGVWWELAGGLTDWAARGRRVLLADYEPTLGYLCVSAIDVEASPAVAAPRLAAQRAP
jgi:hypothetical protein